MRDMKIVKSLEHPGLLIKIVTQTTENETKEQGGRFRGMLLGKLGASLLGDMLGDKGVIEQAMGYSELDRIFNAP